MCDVEQDWCNTKALLDRTSPPTTAAAKAAPRVDETYPLGYLSGLVVEANGQIASAPNVLYPPNIIDRPGCMPFAEYQTNDVVHFLKITGFTVNEAAARDSGINGRALLAMASAPNALSVDSALYKLNLTTRYKWPKGCSADCDSDSPSDCPPDCEYDVVGSASLVHLVERVQNSLTEPLMALPPFMDTCSFMYRKENRGSDVEVSFHFPFQFLPSLSVLSCWDTRAPGGSFRQSFADGPHCPPGIDSSGEGAVPRRRCVYL